MEQYGNLDWDTADPYGAEAAALEDQAFDALRSAGYDHDAAYDVLVRIAENPACIGQIMQNPPEDEDDLHFDWPQRWAEGKHPFLGLTFFA